MYFLIFQPEDILNLCLNESQPIYAYKWTLIKKNVCFGKKQ